MPVGLAWRPLAHPARRPRETVIARRTSRSAARRPGEPGGRAARRAARAEGRSFVARPFAGLPSEPDWVALREVVPSATAPLSVTGPAADPGWAERTVVLATVLPLTWQAMVRGDGSVHLGLQVTARSGDVSRDLAAALMQALQSEPGTSLAATGLPGAGPRLQDLLGPEPLDVTVHAGFEHWVEGVEDPTGEVAASMQRANDGVIPTERLDGVPGAYWCRMPERAHLRYALPDEEAPLLDAMARLAARGPDPADEGLSIGEGSRYVGSFRAHGLLVPVWDLPRDAPAQDWAASTAALRARLDEQLAVGADGTPLSDAERRARSGLLSRQLTLR
jgi:hypothetical protein